MPKMHRQAPNLIVPSLMPVAVNEIFKTGARQRGRPIRRLMDRKFRAPYQLAQNCDGEAGEGVGEAKKMSKPHTACTTMLSYRDHLLASASGLVALDLKILIFLHFARTVASLESGAWPSLAAAQRVSSMAPETPSPTPLLYRSQQLSSSNSNSMGSDTV